MFKIFWDKDILSNNPDKKRGIIIVCGYRCINAGRCNDGKKCKYNKSYRFHNWRVDFHQFFEKHLNIKLPYLVSITKETTDLSGTTMCPYGKSRRYSCFNCIYSGIGDCTNLKRLTMTSSELEVNDPEWGIHERCTLFEKTDWSDSWDKKTGRIVNEKK